MRAVAPTKTNLLKLRDELRFARLGHELLDQKRNILVIELLALVDKAADCDAQAGAALAKAFGTLEDASLAMGTLRLSTLASAINIEAAISLGQRRVMGTTLPVVETSFVEHAPHYSPMDTSFLADEAVADFRKALGLMGNLAELKVSIMRLAVEVRKTIRKVNALEKIAIPDLAESLHYIQGRLEESERDMFVLMKMVKNRISAKAEGVPTE